MAIDLKGMGRKELEALRKRVETQLVRFYKADKKAALKAAEQAARKHGFDLSALTGAEARPQKKEKPTGPKSPPKYAHPENAAVTWTGRGRQPAWIKEGLAAGKSLDDFLIAKKAAPKKKKAPPKKAPAVPAA